MFGLSGGFPTVQTDTDKGQNLNETVPKAHCIIELNDKTDFETLVVGGFLKLLHDNTIFVFIL